MLVGDSDDLLKKADICHAALKEETKMCVIISTPMWSYVRMCYIPERLQKPAFLSSTLSRHDMMVQFTKYYSMHYVAIDASKFDHNIPKWLLKDMWTALRTALSNRFREGNELVRLCDDLCGELDDLVIEVLGARIKYEKGLLSKWRVTSLFGSLISALCCELYINRTCMRGCPATGSGTLHRVTM